MNKQDVIAFFDHCAPTWDAGMVTNDTIIGRILDNARVSSGDDVLDVACGTGVLFPYYLDKGVSSVTGIDISPCMVELARKKWGHESRVALICGDAEVFNSEKRYDAIVVYNAFPHFVDPAALIRQLASLLKEGGCLTVAHGASREKINRHHQGSAAKVSHGLMPAEELRDLFTDCLQVDTVISDETMYQVCGMKR